MASVLILSFSIMSFILTAFSQPTEIDVLPIDISKINRLIGLELEVMDLEVNDPAPITKPEGMIFSVYSTLPIPVNATVTYQDANMNDQNLLTLSTGEFNVEVSGMYLLTFQGIGSAKHSIPHETIIELHVKDLVQANSSTKSTDHYAIGLMAALKLESGDRVSIYVTGAPLYESNSSPKYAHFSGFFIE